jgi:hypothetical protein
VDLSLSQPGQLLSNIKDLDASRLTLLSKVVRKEVTFDRYRKKKIEWKLMEKKKKVQTRKLFYEFIFLCPSLPKNKKKSE